MSSNAARDRELVDAVLAGDPEAYRVLVERESRSVVGLCSAILGNHDDAQDVAQDAFVQAYRSLGGYRGDGSFGAWVGRIATRMAIQRSSAMRRRGPSTELVAELVGSDESANPERHVLTREQTEAIREAIDDLPPDQREVVALRFFRDMPIEQIAAATSTPVGTVKSRLHRALARLRNETDLRSAS